MHVGLVLYGWSEYLLVSRLAALECPLSLPGYMA